MFLTAGFANVGDLDEISELGSIGWHYTFCKSLLFAFADIWNLLCIA